MKPVLMCGVGRLLLAWAAVCLIATPGAAQTFAPGSLTYSPPTLGESRFQKLQVGAYLALWDIPISSPSFSKLRLVTQAGPLVTADVFLSPSLSIGGWWNSRQGVLRLEGPSFFRPLDLFDVSTSFWDAHLTYHAPRTTRLVRGLSLQVGFTGLHYDVDPGADGAVFGKDGYSKYSMSLWLNKSQQIWRTRNPQKSYAISLFGSVGYYTSTDFDNDWNLLVGASLRLNRHLSLSGSVWYNGLAEVTRTRTTIGLVGTF